MTTLSRSPATPPDDGQPEGTRELRPAVGVFLVLGVVAGLVAVVLLRNAGLLLILPLAVTGGCGAGLIVFAKWTRHPMVVRFVGAFAAIVVGIAAVLAIPGLVRENPATPAPTSPSSSTTLLAPPARDTPTDPIPTESSSPSPTPSSNENSSPPQSSNLIVKEVAWPMFADCDGARSAVTLDGQPGPNKYVNKTLEYDLRDKMMADGGAAWELGISTLVFTAPKGKDLVVTSIKPVIFGKSKEKGTWRYAPSGGCGGSENRAYGLQLDSSNPHLFQIETESGEKKSDRFGPSFHVSSRDQVTIEIWASDCDAFIEWGLDVTYSLGGSDDLHTDRIRTGDKPYRSIGGSGAKGYSNDQMDGSVIRDSSLETEVCKHEWAR